MPEPLTTLHRCPRCKAVADPLNPMWRFSEVIGLVEHVHDGIRVTCHEEPVFSAGDMQAALDENAKLAERLLLETENCELARDQVVEFSLKLDTARGREVELAEALRRMVEVFADSPWTLESNMGLAIARARALLSDAPRSHEVVPLGTQEAVRGVVAYLRDGASGRAPITALKSFEWADRLEGAGRTCPKCEGGGKVPDLACADRTLVTCERCHGTGSLGVERTPTPNGPCDRCKGHGTIGVTQPGEEPTECPACSGSGAWDAPDGSSYTECPECHGRGWISQGSLYDGSAEQLPCPACERRHRAAPSPSGITDEQVKAALGAHDAYLSEIASQQSAKSRELFGHSGGHISTIRADPAEAMRLALAAALEHQGGERTPDQISLAAVLALVDLRMPDGNPDDGPPAVQGSVARKLDLLRQGIVGLAEVERVGGERTHTLVPNEHAEAVAAVCEHRAFEYMDPEAHRAMAYAKALRAGARGDRSVQWPETGDDRAS